jgi:hypothetical protein
VRVALYYLPIVSRHHAGKNGIDTEKTDISPENAVILFTPFYFFSVFLFESRRIIAKFAAKLDGIKNKKEILFMRVKYRYAK